MPIQYEEWFQNIKTVKHFLLTNKMENKLIRNKVQEIANQIIETKHKIKDYLFESIV